jgi:hypothetical protein
MVADMTRRLSQGAHLHASAKALAFEVVDNLMHGPANPAEDVWSAFLDAVRTQGAAGTSHLVVTDGGEPSTVQLHPLKDLLAGRGLRAAVVSRSLMVRAKVDGLSYGWGVTRAFKESELRFALAHLKVPSARQGFILGRLAELRAEVGAADAQRWA